MASEMLPWKGSSLRGGLASGIPLAAQRHQGPSWGSPGAAVSGQQQTVLVPGPLSAQSFKTTTTTTTTKPKPPLSSRGYFTHGELLAEEHSPSGKVTGVACTTLGAHMASCGWPSCPQAPYTPVCVKSYQWLLIRALVKRGVAFIRDDQPG